VLSWIHLSLQGTFFSDLKNYGDNILENTNEAILNNSNDSAGFRKLNFSSSQLKDLILLFDHLLTTKWEVRLIWKILEWHCCWYRLFSWAVISLCWFEKSETKVINFVNQALYYARCTCLCCSGRRFFVTAYNIRTVVFALYFWLKMVQRNLSTPKCFVERKQVLKECFSNMWSNSFKICTILTSSNMYPSQATRKGLYCNLPVGELQWNKNRFKNFKRLWSVVNRSKNSVLLINKGKVDWKPNSFPHGR